MFMSMTKDEWLKRVRVDFENGIVYWKPKGENDQPNLRLRNMWNSAWAGKEVGTVLSSRGKSYKASRINNKGYRLHQLIYFLAGNNIEDGLVLDHINGNSLDNRLVNLRAVTQAENNRNVKACRKDSSTGVKGIYYAKAYNKSNNKFVVKVHHHNKQYSLGRYSNLKDAYDVLVKFKIEKGLPVPDYPKNDGSPMVTSVPNPLWGESFGY